MKWDYEYDKEGTWFDNDSGIERYELTQGATLALPHISRKKLEILSVTQEGGAVKAQLYVDYQTVTVSSEEEPVVAHVSDSYSAGGDSVHQSLCLTLSIEIKEE